MQVVVEGGGKFPASLVGRWQSDRDDWQFVIEPNGAISSTVIGLGGVRVKAGQTATVSTQGGGKGTFEPGQWVVHYIPGTSDLTIKITMRHVHIETGSNVLDGSGTDIFVGKVLPAEGLWPVQWTTFSRYMAHTAEKPAAELSTDPDKGETKPLVFRKIQAVE